MDELQDMASAVLVAAAESRDEDVDELLVGLVWPDLVTVVFMLANLALGFVAPSSWDVREPAVRERLAERLRVELLSRAARREGLADE
ncbi:hypothetical protein AB0D90_15610 [Streptomyces althioticus]|uniref:hypothetical protein n=1 Tax=Streptomyces althioticus TaxID=83380 RepID=UPI003407377E